MARPAVFTFPAAVTTAVCTAQTVSGAGTLTIDGTLRDLPATMQGVNRAVFPGIQRVVTLTSAGNVSGVNVTIVGTNLRGATVSETTVGPNANTIATTAQYASVTSVTTDATLSTAMSVGTGSTGVTNWWHASDYAAVASIDMLAAITATMSVTVVNTLDDVNSNASPVTVAHGTLATITSTTQGSYTTPPGWIQAVVNSSSGSGALTFTIVQEG